MKLLFGQSYYLRFDPKLYEAMQPYPPLGCMVTANLMRQKGYEVSFFDAMLAESEVEWQTAVNQHQPDIAIIYEDNFNYLSKMCLLNMRQAAFTMIQMAKEKGCTVIVGGSDASDHAPAYLQHGADVIIRGEGDATLVELVSHLSQNKPLDDILGISYLNGEEVQVNPPRPVMRGIDELPFPAWDLIDVPRYRQIWLERHGYYSMNIVTTRGCPYHCNWCAKPIWGQRYNSRSPENVAEEVIWLHKEYNPDHLWFADDIMGLKPGWWRKYADYLEEAGVKIPFKCLSRADLLVRHNANINALARAGCDIVWIGAESGSQKILDAMEKGTTVEQIYEATEKMHQAGIKIAFFLQFGYPGETWEDIQKTLQMVRDCQPDDIGMSVSYPLPGTRFYENVQQQLGLKQNWTDSADLSMMYEGTYSTLFYRQLHVVLHKEFRSRKGWRWLKETPLSQWGKAHVRELMAIVYRMGSLPWARWQLQRLTAVSHNPLTPSPHMRLEEAAQPSPQQS